MPQFFIFVPLSLYQVLETCVALVLCPPPALIKCVFTLSVRSARCGSCFKSIFLLTSESVLGHAISPIRTKAASLGKATGLRCERSQSPVGESDLARRRGSLIRQGGIGLALDIDHFYQFPWYNNYLLIKQSDQVLFVRSTAQQRGHAIAKNRVSCQKQKRVPEDRAQKLSKSGADIIQVVIDHILMALLIINLKTLKVMTVPYKMTKSGTLLSQSELSAQITILVRSQQIKMLVEMQHIGECESTHEYFPRFRVLHYFQESTYSQLNLFAQVINLLLVDILVLEQVSTIPDLVYAYMKMGSYFLFYIFLYCLNSSKSLLTFFGIWASEFELAVLIPMQAQNMGVRQMLDCYIFWSAVWKMQWVFYPNFIYFLGIQVSSLAKSSLSRLKRRTRLRISEQLFKERVTSLFGELGCELATDIYYFVPAVLPGQEVREVVVDSVGVNQWENQPNRIEPGDSEYNQRGYPLKQCELLMDVLMISEVQVNNIEVFCLVGFVYVGRGENFGEGGIGAEMKWVHSSHQIHLPNFSLQNFSNADLLSQKLRIVTEIKHL